MFGAFGNRCGSTKGGISSLQNNRIIKLQKKGLNENIKQ